ncbi:MAG: M23 family metallopeptidase, partial [Bacteroidales bacterium]|nr:M23 family metallopeptidase [Bacteroidales bacterium]
AHLQYSYVKTGDVLSRGEQLGVMGNSGRSRGPHLHYEVIYRENRVNPLNYYDSSLKGAEYRSMVKQKPKPPQQPKAKKKKRK